MRPQVRSQRHPSPSVDVPQGGAEPRAALVTVVDEDADFTATRRSLALRSAFNYLWIPYDAVDTFLPKGASSGSGTRPAGATAEVKGMLDEHAAGWGMKREEDGDLVLTWKGHNVVFATAWVPS
uniref:Uncharacterized protein n=1 Tax=Ananas comosus var. bracteatus TaxID=296719 RepID=A0A6V7PP13_ANACO|nr:unnamed protein product [Ananas comosus var. bracteatus]